jgi:general secretion pathway protein A
MTGNFVFSQEGRQRIRQFGTSLMYAEYFRLIERPFSLTPDPRFLFATDQHREGLAHLVYGVKQSGGFVQLTGEVGCGKTTLCRCLVNQLPPETDIALILNPRLTVLELLASICDELRIAYPREELSIKGLIDALNAHLLEAHAQHRRTVLIIDEAQNLHPDVLEQIRLLTNLETTRDKLLQVILIGQPELLSMLKRKRMVQLAQRITARYHLLPLSRRETYAYIRHRLAIAGRRDPLFTPWAMRQVYFLSGGVPRLINILCDRALLGAYSLNRRRVNAAIVRRAGRETRGVAPRYRWLKPAWALGAGALALGLGVTIFLSMANPTTFRRTLATSTSSDDTARLPSPAPVPPLLTEASKRANNPAAGPAPKSATSDSIAPRLFDVLSDPLRRGNSRMTFDALYAQWGAQVQMASADLGCSAGRDQGFECLFQVGGWPKLRRFNLPAILELVFPNGLRHRVALVGLGDETASLVIGEQEYLFPLAEIDRVWDGSFILLWKPPFPWHPLSPGARGSDVSWVSEALDRIGGKHAASVSDNYDQILQDRVMEYQRSRSLIPDGFIGSETLVRLTVELGPQNVPSLSRHDP